jgi:hypothetical protein
MILVEIFRHTGDGLIPINSASGNYNSAFPSCNNESVAKRFFPTRSDVTARGFLLAV